MRLQINLRPEYAYAGLSFDPKLLCELGSFGIEVNIGLIVPPGLFVSEEQPPSDELRSTEQDPLVSMKLYEVIFWESFGNTEGDEDTIYLVRAPDFMAAVEEVGRNSSQTDHGGERDRLGHVVYEIGVDASPLAKQAGTRILRGPYFKHAYNYGWRTWERLMDENFHYIREWREQKYGSEPPPA